MILSDSVYESQGWKKIMIFSKLKIRFFNLNQIFFKFRSDFFKIRIFLFLNDFKDFQMIFAV